MEWYKDKHFQEALIFAWEAHFAQTRHGGNPYFVHLDRVTRQVANYTQDIEVLISSILHDGPEDVGVTFEILTEKFGAKVANLVKQLTNDYSDHLPHEEKLRATLEHARHITSPEAKLIKLADRLDNLRDCKSWKAGRKIRYVENTQVLLEGLSPIPEIFQPLVEQINQECATIITIQGA